MRKAINKTPSMQHFNPLGIKGKPGVQMAVQNQFSKHKT
jgi:hypothetical protein